MKFLILLYLVSIIFILGKLCAAEDKERFRFDIAGVDGSELEYIFEVFTKHFEKELSSEYLDLGWNETIYLLNISRQVEKGSVERITFRKGTFFVSYSPVKKTAHSSVNLHPGFEYSIDIKLDKGKAIIERSGLISIGTEPFEIKKE